MRFLRHLFLAIVIVAVAGLAATAFWLKDGIGANAEPSQLEATVARRLRSFAIPSTAKAERNPFASDPRAWRSANEHFQDHCALCHDSDGKGRAVVGRSLYPRAPDMTLPATQDLSDGELFYIIRNGVRLTGMPGWSAIHSVDDTWRLVSFVRHLPSLTPEELAELSGKPGQ